MRSCRPGRLSLVPSAQRCGVTVTSCCSVHLRPSYVGVVLALGAAGGVAAGMAARPLTARIGSARIAWVSMTVFSLPGLLIPLAAPGWRVLLFAAGFHSVQQLPGSAENAGALRAHQSANVRGTRPSIRRTVSLSIPAVSARMSASPSIRASARAGGAPCG